MKADDLPSDELSELFAQVEAELSGDILEFEQFRSWCQEAIDLWEERTETEQESFRQVIEEFEEFKEVEKSSEEIAELREKLSEAYREPIAETVREYIDALSSEVGWDLDDSEIDTFVDVLRSRSNREIEELRDDYEEAYELVESMETSPRTFLGNRVRSDESIITNPEEKLLPTARTAADSYLILDQLTEAFEEYPWSPEQTPSLAEDPSNYPANELEISDYTSKLDQIDASYSTITENSIDIVDILREKMLSLMEGDIESLYEDLEEVEEELEDIARISKEYELAASVAELYSEEIPDHMDLLREGPEAFVDESSSITDLRNSLDSFEDVFIDWKRKLERRWQDLLAIIETYEDQFGFERPEELYADLDILEVLKTDPEEAIRYLRGAQTWVNERGTELAEELETEAVNLMKDLIQEGEVRADNYDIDSIAELHGKVPLLLSIDE